MNTEISTDAIRILQTASCPSLSERSSLTYNVGYTPEADIQFQVFANSGGGFFNNEWVPLNSILQVVDSLPAGTAITSSTFKSIFAGKSNNTSGFLLAVLKHAGLAKAHTDKRRGYEFLDATDFMREMTALVGELPASGDLKKSSKVKTKKGVNAEFEVAQD